MPSCRLLPMLPSWALVLGASLLLAACGGGGSDPFSVPSTQLRITTTTIREPTSGGDLDPQFESADLVDWQVPLEGGCGGPYVLQVIGGALPPGITVVDGVDAATGARLHHLRGPLLAHGSWDFRLQVTDTSCRPFEYATADFRWSVAEGRVAIVGASPALYAPGTYDQGQGPKNPLYPALADVVYGDPVVVEFLVAGGTGPYTIEVVDDPGNPEDGLPPQGVSFPAASRSLVGAPTEIKALQAFVFTLRATDALGQASAPLTVQWEVTAPPLQLMDSVLPDAKCGTPYAKEFIVKGGVPPFRFELVRSDVARDALGEPTVVYDPPNAPLITPTTATQRVTAAQYPAANALGPDYRATLVPPEGLRLGDSGASPYAPPGVLAGTPRRRGQFAFVLYARSSVVPNLWGQHAWRQLELVCAESEPPLPGWPAFGQDPAYTQAGAFSSALPYARIAEAEVGVSGYNPDAATHGPAGLQLLARGGVRKDGLTDAPHASDVTSIEGTAAGQEDGSTPGGGYDWTVDPNPAGDGDAFSTLPPGMALDGWLGVWRVANAAQLVRQGPQGLAFTAIDQQLPTQLRHSATQRVSFGVGPDKVVITESSSSSALNSSQPYHTLNDNAQTVRICLPFATAPVVVRNLELGDLAATHAVPSATGLTASTGLHTLLSGIDLMRACVNPAGWWNDVHNLNPLGARSGVHADRNGFDQYLWGENDSSSTSDYSRQPGATAVALPAYRAGLVSAVSHAPASGTYTDGGKLYPFNNASYFGVFIVRHDSSIYVPFAFSKTLAVGGATYTGFGDGVTEAWSTSGRSQTRIPHLAVSPDGRFGAMKVKTSETSFTEGAGTTKVVIFSLCGEKPFGGQPWTLVDSGSDGSTAQGAYLYAPSMVLTNSHAYWICGNRNGTLTTQACSREHWIYRFQLADPATGTVVAGSTGTAVLCPKADALETAWTNTAGSPLQARFQLYSTPLVSSYAHGGVMHMDGMNLLENSLAPMPFRVSADGSSVAILAMPDQPTANASSQAWHVWVDRQGAGVRRLSSAPLHVTGGAARGYTLARGSSINTYENWHRYGGPTPQLEIADDGRKVAVVANRFAGTPTLSSPTTAWPTAREDVIAWRSSDGVTWTELPVTGDGTSATFSAAAGALWRFGCLTFTKDGAGLVFWGGFSCYNAASSTASSQYSNMLSGTLYGVDLSTATSIGGLTVTSLLAASDGGSAAGIASYTTASPYAPTLPALAYSGVAGVIKPYGGFLSRNREFMYMVNKGALQPSGPDYNLVGVNIRSTNTALSVNGRTDFRGFSFATWPARRGFIGGTYNYYASYGLSLTDYPAYRKHGCSLQVMPRSNGWVFFGSQYQGSGPAVGTGSSSYGGPINSTYSYDYAAYGGEVEAFNADVGGPIVRISAHNMDTNIRRMHFLEPAGSGSDIAYVFDTFGTANCSPSYEQLHAVSGINLDPLTGAQVGTLVRRAVEGSNGRVSDAFAFGSANARLYYAYTPYTSTSNENDKTLREATFTPTGVSTRVLVTTLRRTNVLHAAR